MAAGLPVLTNVPGDVAGLVDQAQGGLSTEPDGLALGIAAMARASASQRDKWGQSGRRYTAKHRSRAKIASELQILLDRVIAP
jgi:hypothetical protein